MSPGGWPQAGRAEDLRQDFRALPLGRRATRYILSYPAYYWANGGIGGASAITLSDGTLGTTGPITTANRVLGGVCGGLEEFFGISAFWFRLSFLIAALPGGVPGISLYLLLWVIIPSA